jgi:hypothetical protein
VLYQLTVVWQVSKRLSAQQDILREVEREGEQLQQHWKKEFRASEMAVSSARAEVEAEERARTHLVGHGDRIKAKLELTTGHLNAQTVVMEDQSTMDNALKAESESVEKHIKEVRHVYFTARNICCACTHRWESRDHPLMRMAEKRSLETICLCTRGRSAFMPYR